MSSDRRLLNVAILYDRSDGEHAHMLRRHLRPFEKEVRIAVWHPNKTPPGADRERTFSARLSTADVVLLLFTKDFFQTYEQYRTQVRSRPLIIPILLRHCTPPPDMLSLQWLPRDGRPILDDNAIRGNDTSHDDRFKDVALELLRVFWRAHGVEVSENLDIHSLSRAVVASATQEPPASVRLKSAAVDAGIGSPDTSKSSRSSASGERRKDTPAGDGGETTSVSEEEQERQRLIDEQRLLIGRLQKTLGKPPDLTYASVTDILRDALHQLQERYRNDTVVANQLSLTLRELLGQAQSRSRFYLALTVALLLGILLGFVACAALALTIKRLGA